VPGEEIGVVNFKKRRTFVGKFFQMFIGLKERQLIMFIQFRY
jgi:hypothetical protein